MKEILGEATGRRGPGRGRPRAPSLLPTPAPAR
eukprot:CAMPEP_0204357274 /NCGR_PEP_ID=MMETSP0469-20131031/35614_1 /ASSEMBLY_ACC=CAM_ASM_000384 /TAXON_ID=2969 /ORGANISM="Oxyrrhis marina" /LENGTH=32 /DNA_ID= /DNA_START= /DNA_END= /DNA_ORIENTATION=